MNDRWWLNRVRNACLHCCPCSDIRPVRRAADESAHDTETPELCTLLCARSTCLSNSAQTNLGEWLDSYSSKLRSVCCCCSLQYDLTGALSRLTSVSPSLKVDLPDDIWNSGSVLLERCCNSRRTFNVLSSTTTVSPPFTFARGNLPWPARLTQNLSLNPHPLLK